MLVEGRLETCTELEDDRFMTGPKKDKRLKWMKRPELGAGGNERRKGSAHESFVL